MPFALRPVAGARQRVQFNHAELIESAGVERLTVGSGPSAEAIAASADASGLWGSGKQIASSGSSSPAGLLYRYRFFASIKLDPEPQRDLSVLVDHEINALGAPSPDVVLAVVTIATADDDFDALFEVGVQASPASGYRYFVRSFDDAGVGSVTVDPVDRSLDVQHALRIRATLPETAGAATCSIEARERVGGDFSPLVTHTEPSPKPYKTDQLRGISSLHYGLSATGVGTTDAAGVLFAAAWCDQREVADLEHDPWAQFCASGCRHESLTLRGVLHPGVFRAQAAVRFELDTDPSFPSPTVVGVVDPLGGEDAHWVSRAGASGLTSNTTYWWRAVVLDGSGDAVADTVGSFAYDAPHRATTLPAPDEPATARMIYTSCRQPTHRFLDRGWQRRTAERLDDWFGRGEPVHVHRWLEDAIYTFFTPGPPLVEQHHPTTERDYRVLWALADRGWHQSRVNRRVVRIHSRGDWEVTDNGLGRGGSQFDMKRANTETLLTTGLAEPPTDKAIYDAATAVFDALWFDEQHYGLALTDRGAFNLPGTRDADGEYRSLVTGWGWVVLGLDPRTVATFGADQLAGWPEAVPYAEPNQLGDAQRAWFASEVSQHAGRPMLIEAASQLGPFVTNRPDAAFYQYRDDLDHIVNTLEASGLTGALWIGGDSHVGHAIHTAIENTDGPVGRAVFRYELMAAGAHQIAVPADPPPFDDPVDPRVLEHLDLSGNTGRVMQSGFLLALEPAGVRYENEASAAPAGSEWDDAEPVRFEGFLPIRTDGSVSLGSASGLALG